MDTGSRRVTFGGSRVRIDHRGRLARAIAEVLAPSASWRHDPAELTTSEAVATIDVRGGDDVLYQGPSAVDAARTAQEAMGRWFAAHSTGGLLFHAAALGHAGHALLLAGGSGSGKTTLTAALVAHGAFDYLTDELSFVADGSAAVEGWRRPLSVKASGRNVIGDLGTADGWQVVDSAVVRLLLPPPAASDSARVPVSFIVFPHFGERAFALEPLTPAECALRLFGCLLNAGAVADHGVTTIVNLSRRVTALAMPYRDVARVVPHLRSLMATGVGDPLDLSSVSTQSSAAPQRTPPVLTISTESS